MSGKEKRGYIRVENKMAENRKNKFSYDRSYYEIMRKAPVDGSAAIPY